MLHGIMEIGMTTSVSSESDKSTFPDIPLLSLDRQSIVSKTTLAHREENRNHFISVEVGPCCEGQIFEGWSAKIALDNFRQSLEKDSLLIGVEGALIYASYSRMCHDMGQGYSGYNYKNRKLGDMSIPERISTFDIVNPVEHPFVSSLADQQEFTDNPDMWQKIITERSNPSRSLKSILLSIFKSKK
jgi:hypothetical protein